jgi:hypothetical protein
MQYVRRWVGLFAIGATLLGLVAAGAWSIRIAWADYQMRRESMEGIRAAISIEPDNAEYYTRLAWPVSNEDPRKARDALRQAVALNPWDAASWIDLGLQAEADGNQDAAQRWLSRAAEVDKEFLPGWTLANYYFRHNDGTMFWVWAKNAAAMVYGDAQPLFRMCGRLEEDGKLIERLGIRSPDVRAEYLSYLLGGNRLDLIDPAVDCLLEEKRAADVPLLLTVCDRFLDARRVTEAANIWNRLAGSGVTLPPAPGGQGEEFLTNADFRWSPSSRGFDWLLLSIEGVSASREEGSGGMRITFSGQEPEQCEVLAQLVPVTQKMRCQLRFGYRTGGVASGAGLAWRVMDSKSGVILTEGNTLASEMDTEGRLDFETRPESSLVRLALVYRRTPGTTRIEGFLILHKATLKMAGQSPIDGALVRK